jgi:hypothetical protein
MYVVKLLNYAMFLMQAAATGVHSYSGVMKRAEESESESLCDQVSSPNVATTYEYLYLQQIHPRLNKIIQCREMRKLLCEVEITGLTEMLACPGTVIQQSPAETEPNGMPAVYLLSTKPLFVTGWI